MRLALLVFALCCALTGGAAARTAVDQHVDRLSSQTLLNNTAAVLVDPVRQRRARAIADYQELTFAAWAIAPIVAFFWLWRSGNSARLRDLFRRRFPTPWVCRMAFGKTLGLLAWLVQLPFGFAGYRLAFGVDMTTQPVGTWFEDELLRLVLIAVCTGIGVAVVLELADRTRLWYIAFIAFLYAVVFATVAIEPALFSPLTSDHRPAPAAIVAQGDAAARAVGTAPVPIEIVGDSARTNDQLARTSGLGPFARILLGDTVINELTPAERMFTLARQYAHERQHDVFWLTLSGTTLFVIAAALAILISDRIGFRRDDDALSRLGLVGTFLGLMVLLLYPIDTLIQRGIEARADQIAVAALHDPADGVRLLVRRADDDLVPICGRRSLRWYFERRPSIGSRVAALSGVADSCPK